MGELGPLIATEILETFKETFRDKDFSASVVKNTMYSSFNYKLYDCINATLRRIVLKCSYQAHDLRVFGFSLRFFLEKPIF